MQMYANEQQTKNKDDRSALLQPSQWKRARERGLSRARTHSLTHTNTHILYERALDKLEKLYPKHD